MSIAIGGVVRMRTSTLLVFGFLCSLLSAGPAMAIEPGEYTGKAEYGGDLALKVRGANATIEVIADGCLGEAISSLTRAGDGHWQMHPDLPGCVIDLKQKGSRVTVLEGDACHGLHGMRCTFDGYVTAGGGAGTDAASPPQTQAGTTSGTWTYGVDPVLGLTAHIRTEDGALGIACIADESNPANVEIVAVRATPEMTKLNGMNFAFVDKMGGGNLPPAEGKPFSELRDTTCGISLDSFQAARSMYLHRAKLVSVQRLGDSYEATYDLDGKRIVVDTGSDSSSELDGKIISLKGSSAAIRKLLRACPMARRDIEANCGI